MNYSIRFASTEDATKVMKMGVPESVRPRTTTAKGGVHALYAIWVEENSVPGAVKLVGDKEAIEFAKIMTRGVSLALLEVWKDGELVWSKPTGTGS